MLSTLGLLLSLAAAQAGGACVPPSGAAAADGQACTPASAADDQALRRRINAYLGAIDRPISAEAWRALGPQAIPILAEIAGSDQADWKRANALAALGAIGGDQAEAAIVAGAHDAQSSWKVRLSAVRAAGRALPADRVERELRPVLEADPSPHVRAAAAEALTQRSGGAGCDAVKGQQAREPAERRALYQKALKVGLP
jgi:HEAT repeat protein